jgi:hypothetical protein
VLASGTGPGAERLPAGTADLATLRLADLQAKFAEVTGKTTKARKKADLIKRITEAMESAETPKKAPAKKKAKTAKAAEKAPETASDEPEGDGDAEGDEGHEKASKLDVPALQARYRELVGRETRSTSRRYLIWRVQQAEKGRIPTGSRRRKLGPDGEPIAHKVLPIRVPADPVPTPDEA